MRSRRNNARKVGSRTVGARNRYSKVHALEIDASSDCGIDEEEASSVSGGAPSNAAPARRVDDDVQLLAGQLYTREQLAQPSRPVKPVVPPARDHMLQLDLD